MKRWHAVFLLAAAVCAAMGLILCREPVVLPAGPERPVQTAEETRLWLREQAHRLVTEEDAEGVVLDCAAGQDGGSLAMAVLYRGGRRLAADGRERPLRRGAGWEAQRPAARDGGRGSAAAVSGGQLRHDGGGRADGVVPVRGDGRDPGFPPDLQLAPGAGRPADPE